MQVAPQLALQVRVSRMLGYGFVFSISALGGVGSLIAVIIGLRARRIIKASGGEVTGIGMAWWCIVAGALGVGFQLAYWTRFVSEMTRTK
jgi:hypothetical protein